MATRFTRYQFRLKQVARSLRREATPAERKLWHEYLKHIPEKFTRQKPLGRYVADFYCAARRLVIEIDGDSHFHAGSAAHDAQRSADLAQQGIRVVRFTNAEVTDQFEGVCLAIRAALDNA